MGTTSNCALGCFRHHRPPNRMAAQAGPLAQVKLPSGPSPITAEQRYWKTFKNQLLIASPTSYPVTHISNNSDSFAVTTGTRVQIYSNKTRKLLKTITRFGNVAHSGEIRKDGRVLVAGDDTGFTCSIFTPSSWEARLSCTSLLRHCTGESRWRLRRHRLLAKQTGCWRA